MPPDALRPHSVSCPTGPSELDMCRAPFISYTFLSLVRFSYYLKAKVILDFSNGSDWMAPDVLHYQQAISCIPASAANVHWVLVKVHIVTYGRGRSLENFHCQQNSFDYHLNARILGTENVNAKTFCQAKPEG